MRSEGSILLQRAPGTQEEKARKLGVDQATVSRWCTGATKPRSFEDRDACRRVYGIDLDAWSREPAPAPSAQPAAA